MNDELEDVQIARIDYYSELAKIAGLDQILPKSEARTAYKICSLANAYSMKQETYLLELPKHFPHYSYTLIAKIKELYFRSLELQESKILIKEMKLYYAQN